MSFGVILLAHTALHRAEQVARHWSENGCPVVIHVDEVVPKAEYDRFRASLSDCENLLFSRRYRCEWGTWGLVAASLDAATMMLKHFDVAHVYLTSGACLPLRPVRELRAYLAERPRTDFIESATTADVSWTVDGLDQERFSFYFPFSWKRQRIAFDAWVRVQRALGVQRKLPKGVVPHMGSQWWCLTRGTLSAILNSPDRRVFDRYFRRVWIPDESYFQSLARLFSSNIESRSLTLSKFDFQGKPHIFYDDHLQLLRRSDCFVARKIWPHADRLYDAFLGPPPASAFRQEPNPGKIDRVFSKAVDRRTRGRAGLYMQSRFPNYGWENGTTAAKYSVFHGFDELTQSFPAWLSGLTGAQVHGHLFAPDRVEFAGGERVITGALTDDAAPRDANPKAFLTNLIWNTRGERQCFLFGAGDKPAVLWHMARDANAQISVVTGAWSVPLAYSDEPFDIVRAQAARLQNAEAKMLDLLHAPDVKARIRIWSMADFLENPKEPLQMVIGEIGLRSADRSFEQPELRDLSDFGQFLQRLKNAGMHPYLTGDIPLHPAPQDYAAQTARHYVAQ